MEKVVFVILHYVNFLDSYECINSILTRTNYDNYDIVIVDNNSPNDSFIKLKEQFGNIGKCYFIKNNENLGFAKGNNVGFQYAKNKLNADFIVMINNDTIIDDYDFLNKLIVIHHKTNFNILGPDIISTKDGQHQNPQRTVPLSLKEINHSIRQLKILKILNKLYLDKMFLNLKHYIKYELFKIPSGYNSEINWNREFENVQLHGAALIFDKEYIIRYDGLFDKTFMYAEEDILYRIAQKDNLKIIYSPDIKIYHKEGSSTAKVFKSREKRMFNYNNSSNSLKFLKKIIG